MTVRLAGALACSSAARSRSISNAVTDLACAVSVRVSAPCPRPISKKSSAAAAPMPLTPLTTPSGVRKCCPKRLRAIIPIVFFNVHDLRLTHAEVVADLMNERLADLGDHSALAARFALDRPLKQQDAIGQRVAVIPTACRKRRALVEAEERAVRSDAHGAEQPLARLVFDDDGAVGHGVAERLRNRCERVSDEAFELFALHCSRPV